MEYTNLTSAQDWFFRHDNPQQGGLPIVYQVAVWATKKGEDGKSVVVGLIAPIFPGEGGRKLHEPPPVEGHYIHREQLTSEEREALKKR